MMTLHESTIRIYEPTGAPLATEVPVTVDVEMPGAYDIASLMW
jgi:hypothetical protein